MAWHRANGLPRLALAAALSAAAVLLALAADLPQPVGLTTPETSEQAYQQPLAILSPAQLARFAEGKEGFRQHWVVAPSILGLWGRGPISNGEACTDCHENGGRGRPPAARASRCNRCSSA